MDDLRGLFITIPTCVVTDQELTDGSKLLYGFIISLAQQSGYCFATNAYLAELMNTSERSVQNYVRTLKNAGYIDVELIYGEKGEIKERHIRCMISFKGEKLEQKKARKTKEDQRHAYGSMKNVLLTDKQYSDLKAMYPGIDAEIENMSLYCAANGKPYKNCYAALLNWMRRRAEEQPKKGSKWDGVNY